MERPVTSITNTQFTMKVNPVFYPDKIVEKSLQEFREFCTGQRQRDNVIIEAPEEGEKVCFELYNYMLTLMKNEPFTIN